MKTQDFDYALPDGQIAAYPLDRRDESRLLRLDRASGAIKHLQFRDIANQLPPRSLLVLNDTRVVPARLRGRRPTGGAVELLLIRRVVAEARPPESRAVPVGGPGAEEWEAMARNVSNVTPGTRLTLGSDPSRPLVAEVIRRGDDGRLQVSLQPPPDETVRESIDRIGEMPLPPYILAARRRAEASVDTDADADLDLDLDNQRTDRSPAPTSAGPGIDGARYQTVYAAHPGAVAAPTAGLHFTVELLDRVRAAGHETVALTLHVGPGTFRPVAVDEIDDHVMEAETYTIPAETATAIEEARRAGRPIVAVGTTVVRALETAARLGDGVVRSGSASSHLFLKPGDAFAVVTELVTNFHLPRSTLLMLVAAFAGRDRVLAAYAEAIAKGYRFYSYGDAMLIRGSL